MSFIKNLNNNALLDQRLCLDVHCQLRGKKLFSAYDTLLAFNLIIISLCCLS